MILIQTIGKGAKVGHGLGRKLQGIQMVPSTTPKRKHYGVGYQLHDQRRNGRIQKEKNDQILFGFSSFKLDLQIRGIYQH